MKRYAAEIQSLLNVTVSTLFNGLFTPLAFEMIAVDTPVFRKNQRLNYTASTAGAGYELPANCHIVQFTANLGGWACSC